MSLIRYVSFILFIFNVLFAIDAYQTHHLPVSLTNLAREPVVRIFNTKLYYDESARDRSKEELSTTIRQIYLLRDKLHNKDSREVIDMALPSLVQLHYDLKADTGNIEMNEHFVKMLLALSYVQVRYAQTACAQRKTAEVHTSLRTAMGIIRRALFLSEGTKRDFEINIYAEMFDLLKTKVSHEEMEKRLGSILDEIRDLEVSFHH